MTLSLTRRPSGLVPIVMSLAAVTTILCAHCRIRHRPAA